MIKGNILEACRKSCGDWRYPFLQASWSLARMIVPRKNVRVDNIEFSLTCDNWITHFRWYLFKKKEVEIRRFIDSHIRNSDIFFDIGANVGVFSLYAAKKYPRLSVYCFEPEFSNLSLLKENLWRNNLQGRIKVFGVGVGDSMGISELHLQDLTPGSACHTASNQQLEKTAEGFPVVWSEGIFVVTLDRICEDLNLIPNVLKIDTDGNEDKVLTGAARLLRNSNLRAVAVEMPLDLYKKEVCRQSLQNAGFCLDPDIISDTRNEVWVR